MNTLKCEVKEISLSEKTENEIIETENQIIRAQRHGKIETVKLLRKKLERLEEKMGLCNLID